MVIIISALLKNMEKNIPQESLSNAHKKIIFICVSQVVVFFDRRDF